MLSRSSLLAAALGSLVLGCTGTLGDPPESESNEPPGPGPGSTPTFDCNAGATPAAVPLRRSSKVQYLHTLRDMVALALPDEVDAVMAAVKPKTEIVPDDLKVGPTGPYGGFQRLDQDVGQDLVDRDYAIATALGAELTSTPARLTKLAGACATDADAGKDDTGVNARAAQEGPKRARLVMEIARRCGPRVACSRRGRPLGTLDARSTPTPGSAVTLRRFW
jgi:hypothetical protein